MELDTVSFVAGFCIALLVIGLMYVLYDFWNKYNDQNEELVRASLNERKLDWLIKSYYNMQIQISNLERYYTKNLKEKVESMPANEGVNDER